MFTRPLRAYLTSGTCTSLVHHSHRTRAPNAQDHHPRTDGYKGCGVTVTLRAVTSDDEFSAPTGAARSAPADRGVVARREGRTPATDLRAGRGGPRSRARRRG